MKSQNLTCIGCPLGCSLQVTLDDTGAVAKVQGHTCPRGDLYARKEITNPTRIVTSTVRVTGSKDCAVTVSVKTESDISKTKIFDCIKEIKNITVCAPVKIGDVVKANVAGTGVNIIATKNVV
ncbi:MAG: NAD(FAD)-dependent dehydrogenase [Oscillospiraceae bacterium]|jgi:CxxC motif-containing protein|nr:NAD(FAD)-dependent dehydrogenase [Oscillospiraceae bacterium]